MPRIKLHLTNGDSPEFTVSARGDVDEIRDDIDAGRWLNFANTRFIRSQSVVWIEFLDDADEPA